MSWELAPGFGSQALAWMSSSTTRSAAASSAAIGAAYGKVRAYPHGGEIMTIIQVAMLGKLPDTAMANAIFGHALLAEGLNTLFEMLDA